MQIHREKVREHADRRLSVTDPFDPAKATQLLRCFLKLEDERLRMAIRRGAAGCWLSEARCFVLDVVVQHVFRDAGLPTHNVTALEKAKSAFAVVAIGGYG